MRAAVRRFVYFLALPLCGTAVVSGIAAERKLSVLFIGVDDLRPDLGCYGHPLVQSPHIDRLAARGAVFTRAYSQQATCNPSRASLLTGLRPETLSVYNQRTHFREKRPNAITLPQYFKEHGYYTQTIGKIFHTDENRDDALSWSVQDSSRSSGARYGPGGAQLLRQWRAEARQKGDEGPVRGLPWEAPEVDDDSLTDGTLARRATETLRALAGKVFFLAVGFSGPHPPFVAPRKYWDLYPPDRVMLANNPLPAVGAPAPAGISSSHLRGYRGLPKVGPFTEEQALSLRRGYWACVSYVDAQIGRLLSTLEDLRLQETTVVVLWSDHGFHLGEHGFWGKSTNYEDATRTPLVVFVPGQRPVRIDALVELVDIFPFLVDSCGLPELKNLEGLSFLPLLRDPARSWKQAVFHSQPRWQPGTGTYWGRSIRTSRYRLVEWTHSRYKAFREYELYDYEQDPAEELNLAGQPEYESVLEELLDAFRRGWRGALPGPSGK